MILGQGSAKNDSEIITEYHNFLNNYRTSDSRELSGYLHAAPEIMCGRIGKSISKWKENDILAITANRQKSTKYYYGAFLAFLFFRGYLRASLKLLTTLTMKPSRIHRRALLPYRQKIIDTKKELGYIENDDEGNVLNLLAYFLSTAYKPLNEITRADFDDFKRTYSDWYRKSCKQKHGSKTN